MVSTGISRRVLLALNERDPLTVSEIFQLVTAPGVTEGTVWTILSRARGNGLVRREKAADGLWRYALTGGGRRRVVWIIRNGSGRRRRS